MRKFVIALILGWMMVFFINFNLFYFIENPLLDKMTMKTRPVDPRIKIIAIDSESLNKIGTFPWPRDKMAALIEKPATGGASAVWLNMPLTEKSKNPEEDKALAQVVAKHNNVYLPVYFQFEALQKTKKEMQREYLKLPVIDIPKEKLGHINILPDKDLKVRRVLLGIPNLEEEIIPLIDVRLANLLLPEDSRITWDQNYVWQRGQEKIPIDERLQVSFAYASSPLEPKFDIIPAWRVIAGEIDPAYFKDSLVLIGIYSAELQDQYSIPLAKSRMHSVEVHANIIQAFLDNELYTGLMKSKALIIVVLSAMLGYALFRWAKAKRGAVILALLIIGYSGVVYYFSNTMHLLLPYFYTLFALVAAYLVSIGEQVFIGRKTK